MTTRRRGVVGVTLGLALGLAACGGSSGSGGTATGSAKYVVGTMVSLTDSQSGYVELLPSLSPAGGTVDLKKAYEFPGQSDVWVFQGSVFVSGGEAPTITKYSVASDGSLVQQATLSFANYGVTDSAFWNNTFVSADKAYLAHGTAEYVVWNPTTMQIVKTVPLPALAPHTGLSERLGLSDRSAVVSNGKIFQPVYWSDDSYAQRSPDSQIVVLDTATDTVVSVLDAGCPGLDHATLDESGNAWFSPWTGGAGAHLVLGSAATCVVKVDTATLATSIPFSFADIAGGREGAAFHSVGNGQFVFTALHSELVDLAHATDPLALVAGAVWRVWRYDATTGQSTEMDSIPLNSGAVYWFDLDGTNTAFIPGADYASSTAYQLTGTAATSLFTIDGFAFRLFSLQ